MCLFLLVTLPGASIAAADSLFVDEPDNSQRALDILEAMTPEQRVGQLFLVTFDGATVDTQSRVYELVERYGIGGVVLTADHDNFDDTSDVVVATRNLVTSLQQVAWQAANTISGDDISKSGTTEVADVYLPLLVGINYQGGGASTDGMHSGLTAAPSAMALGAAWDPSAAGVMGEIAGYELNGLGINLQIGPALDVVESPTGYNPGDPGVRAFGGSAYWVGTLSREYIAGVHRGSAGRIAFVGQSFPGLGSGDRESALDIPTVNKSIEQLLNVDLVPFFTVSASYPGDEYAIDVLMPAQGRYSAWQGSLSSDTRPLGMDAAALADVMRLSQLSEWRERGGIIMSAPLGRRGIRRYYDPSGMTFPAFEIARDALLAGNDLLFIDEYVDVPEKEQYASVTDTIGSFVRKYREDAAFAERVDIAAERIVALKLRLYGNDISITNVLSDDGLDDIGDREDDVFSLARKSVTLLSPTLSEVANRLPRPPARLERIVIFTDSKVEQQCSACFEVAYPEVNALENAIARLYGFGGSAQISSLDVFSFSFDELEVYLDAGELSDTAVIGETEGNEVDESMPTATVIPEIRIRDALRTARWLVFALGDTPTDDNALRRFLSEVPDQLMGRNVVVFALGAPYYLDATEVAQLTAYYGLYGHSSSFIEVAARVLFQEITPHQASPVSVESVSYDLLLQLQADPTQRFLLSRVVTGDEETENDESIQSGVVTPTPANERMLGTPVTAEEVAEGSAIHMQAGPLLDRNGYVVPDGTVVEFDASYLAEGLTETFAISSTSKGIARATLVLDRIGLVDIIARAGDALSVPLQIDVGMSEGETLIQVQTIVPTVTVTPTSSPTALLTVTRGAVTQRPTEEATKPIATVTLTPTISPTAVPGLVTPTAIMTPDPSPYLDPRDLLSAVLAMVILSSVSWSAASMRGLFPLLHARLRLLLYVTVGVWAGYDYYAIQLPGAELFRGMGAMAPALFSWGGGMASLLLGLFWPSAWIRRLKVLYRDGVEGGDDSKEN